MKDQIPTPLIPFIFCGIMFVGGLALLYFMVDVGFGTGDYGCKRNVNYSTCVMDNRIKEERKKVFEGPCVDMAILAGSTFRTIECPNKNHQMVIEASMKAGEEVGAVAHCKCIVPNGEKQ